MCFFGLLDRQLYNKKLSGCKTLTHKFMAHTVIKKNLHLFKSILFLLGEKRYKIPWLILAFIFSSFLEIVGISLIAPYIALI